MAEIEATPMAVDEPTAEQKKRIAGEADTGCSERERFLLELEFVQGLANPQYLNWLAQNKYLVDPAFIKYLDYLQYWREPKYCKYIIYPQSLYFLDLLQSESFRTAVANPAVREMIHRQQLFFWKHFRANRVKEETEEQDGALAGENGPEDAAPAGNSQL